MSASPARLRVESLTWKFPGLPVPLLDDLSFRLERPGLYALVGPSGSGKSTLLSLLAGFYPPGPGHVFWNGEDFGGLDREEMRRFRRRRMGFVFQDSLLIPEFDVADNVGLRGMLAGQPVGRVRQQAMERLDDLRMGGLAARHVNGLSVGEAMRVAILRALFAEPEYLLADEPTGGLDRETARDVMRMLVDEIRRKQVTALIATHDEEMVTLCDGTLRLQSGRVVS